jgi:hypothetical protein
MLSTKLAPRIAFGALVMAAWAAEVPRLSTEDMDKFLRTAKIATSRELSEGVTSSRRATLSDGALTHDAHIQTIAEFKPQYQTPHGAELNFMDNWKFNVAAYLLDRMMGLGMTPMSVERKVGGTSASITWWVDDVLMTEKQRYQQNTQPPDPDLWNRQMNVVRVFDELIFNTDRNLGNLVITRNWDLWMIDHTRAFRTSKTLRNPKNLVKCDQYLLEKLKALNKEELNRTLKGYLNGMQIDGMLARRDLIVQLFEKEAAAKGESAVLYEYLPRK